MTQIVLVHSALGLTRHVQQWAEILSADGHDVHTPDLFDGRTFGDLETAVDHVDSEGMEHWIARARALTAALDGPRVYAGFSLGGAVAEILALTEPDATGLVVMHGAISPAWFEIDEWPADLVAQLHYAERDPWVDADDNAAFLTLAGDACEEFVHPGDGHLFGFEGWHEYDDVASHDMYERVSEFMSELDG
ncbi:dienelactone hydrolase family protein [Demequina zhanjiangensis]|uniref:Dienelactone hydrolase family protein n=1 Tax=Demequina zhanjiangensis TaxID=3051659 RepID=A0ABT8G472_9MICO|nr:dienelactone hydrolase family protein [Demequina sp. SYSU T00b26]MDN4473945.1 dienelactone hydrolase family protein [Demequina sp. SYSU T00b26]